ncbi:MAG: 4Fe-4S dicluster domain-containing protein [Bacillota bacterium]
MIDLSIELFGKKYKNPVMPAAGPPIKDAKLAHRAAEGGAGAIVTKTISVKAAQVPRPNMAEIRGGFMNTELWSEMGPEQWINHEYPEIVKTGLPVIIGLGYTAEEIKELAEKVEPFADALELSTHYLGDDPTPVVESIKAAKEAADVPVMVKLSPQIDIPMFAKAAEEAGADGLVLINSFGPTLDFDVEDGRPLMGSANGFGWLSGPAIFPLALRAVYQAVTSVDIPVIGVGGISRGIDAIKMIMIGAQAVQMCTAPIIKGPGVYGKVVKEMEEFMAEHGYSSLDEIRGMAVESMYAEDKFTTIKPEVNEENCTTCMLCVHSCVYDAISLDESEDFIVIDPEKCVGCGLCVTRCNFDALHLPAQE